MIREISEKDSETLAGVHRHCFTDGWSEKSFQEMLSQKTFWGVAEVEDFQENLQRKIATYICGFILAKIVCDEAEIITFCVLPKFRKRGLGKSLLRELIKYSKDNQVKNIFLEVSEDNREAIKLYKSVGYQEISQRPNYYRTKQGVQNAILMVKRL